MMSSVMLFLIFRPAKDASRRLRVAAYGKQLGYAAGLSLLVAVGACLIASWIGGADIPFGKVMLLLWLGSFSIMALFVGVLSVFAPLGILVIATTVIMGMFTGLIPSIEMLPDFWRYCVAPWAPQRYIGDGLRALVAGGSVLNPCIAFIITGAVGILAFTLAIFIPRQKIKAWFAARKKA